MPKYFLFGLYRIQMYEYYWGHTKAQIELIDIDQPFTAWAKSENTKKPGDKGYKPDKKKLDAAVERWKQRKAEREKRGFSLDAFLNTGKKIPTTQEE